MIREQEEQTCEHDEKEDVDMRPAVAENTADEPGVDLLEARRVEADEQQDLQRVQARCDGDAVEDQIVGARHAAAPVREEKDESCR